MARSLLALAASAAGLEIALVAGLASAAAPPPSAFGGQRGPRLSLEPESWDFGSAGPGEVLVHEFLVRNTGDRDLEIGRIASACACAAAITERPVVPPGEAATLRVTLETRRYRGVLERWLTIRSNDPRSATRLKVRVYVEAAPRPTREGSAGRSKGTITPPERRTGPSGFWR